MSKKQNYISQLITRLREQGAIILLESQMKNHPASTKSFLAAQPKAWIKAYGNEIRVIEDGEERITKGNPWDALQKFRSKTEDWLFGYLGYDLKNYVEEVSSENQALNDAPDLFFMVPELLLEIDSQHNIQVIKGELPEGIEPSEIRMFDKFSVQLESRIEETEYLKRVEMAQKDIFEGDYYEINLSHPLQFSFYGDPLDLYERMKEAGRVPFGSYVEVDGLAICCASPERFLAKKGSRVWSQPIKGTAARLPGQNPSLDIERLKNSEKERAENLMIVDLVRNDLSRIALKKSVKVSKLFEIQSFETVHQMVSTVECEVEKSAESIDLIKACFPMGSMTGAPKIAAMKAIDEYENYKRGVYSGALGYISPEGDFDFNVIIRTAIIDGNNLVNPVGGAITSDSDANAEWEETLLKARAITNILEIAKKPE
ncbi:MAG: anthranilate synthase component I family protein [Gracilimonas sp.]|uniref:anthranilate synthase component I family protein n=1 Tax=Gracilimonas sp. TaxID=1974203 RepID=UPI0019AD6441|nr:anthranilate synthase component I family protein [Gracilimonas sp.]MBD3616374.1 anthranilate synthase component I family protein [Gracilimonas sp.]